MSVGSDAALPVSRTLPVRRTRGSTTIRLFSMVFARWCPWKWEYPRSPFSALRVLARLTRWIEAVPPESPRGVAPGGPTDGDPRETATTARESGLAAPLRDTRARCRAAVDRRCVDCGTQFE